MFFVFRKRNTFYMKGINHSKLFSLRYPLLLVEVDNLLSIETWFPLT